MVGVILTGGGRGTRLKKKVPKAFVKLAGKELFLYSLETFSRMRRISKIVLVLPEKYCSALSEIKKRFPKIQAVVPGGRTRGDSVFSGLRALAPACSLVLVHDLARPFVSPALIDRVLRTARRRGACIPALRITDTFKTCRAGVVTRTLNRDEIFRVQTPQGFSREILMKAYHSRSGKHTAAWDDAALVERTGQRVYVVPGEERNIKITGPFDLKIARLLCHSRG